MFIEHCQVAHGMKFKTKSGTQPKDPNVVKKKTPSVNRSSPVPRKGASLPPQPASNKKQQDKTAISRAIAPLPPSVSQAGPRLGLHQTAGMLGQAPASPAKFKQKMSPRGNNVGPGRPPRPKNLNTPKMMPKLPGGLESVVGGKPSEGVAGPPPPTLLLQMLPAQHVALSTTVAPAPPHSMLVSMPPMPVKPLCQMSSSIPTSTVTAQETNGGRQNMFRREQKKENMNGTDKSGEEGLKEEKKAENTAVPVAENAAA